MYLHGTNGINILRRSTCVVRKRKIGNPFGLKEGEIRTKSHPLPVEEPGNLPRIKQKLAKSFFKLLLFALQSEGREFARR